jgi:hypothetical protein
MKTLRRGKYKILSQRDGKKREILFLTDRLNFWFEKAISPRINELSNEINELTEKLVKTEQDRSDYEESHDVYDEDGRPHEEYLDFFGEIGELHAEIDLLLMQQLSIEEMKIVCLYKEFEILLKEMIKISFNDIDINHIYKWEQIKSILNNVEINIGDIDSHNQINELRIVNNNIKHSNIISEKVLKDEISEFEGKKEFDSQSLSNFYSRIRNEPKIFIKSLANKIIDYLFFFDDERIENIVNQYKFRMDKKSAIKLAESLTKTFS